MSLQLNKKSIQKKTALFGALTFLSRILGIAREFFIAMFLGAGGKADAFFMAFKIPHFLRRIFAEGALSAAFVPVFVKRLKKGELKDGNGLMSISFLFFEGLVFLMCLFVFIYPAFIFKFLAPGFSQMQLAYATSFVRILFPIIFFISSSALFAGALNAVNHIAVPAFAPALMNIVFVFALIICIFFKLDVYYLCLGILFSGFMVFILHFITYLAYGFSFGKIDKGAILDFKLILKRFIPSLLGVGIVEINLFLDLRIASHLPEGSISLLNYSGRFMNIPIGIFAVGFATVLLPQFTRYAMYAPRRLIFNILEVCKLVTFLIVPAMLSLMFLAEPIFRTFALSGKMTSQHIQSAKLLLIIYSSGLVFFCLNKILVNVFYAMHDTITPTISLVISALTNYFGNKIGMKYWGAYGIAGATVVSAIVLSLLFFIFLKTKHKFGFYFGAYFNFLGRYLIQLFIASSVFLSSYFAFFYFLSGTSWYPFFHEGWGYWLFIFPLITLVGLFLFYARKLFGIKLYFLSK